MRYCKLYFFTSAVITTDNHSVNKIVSDETKETKPPECQKRLNKPSFCESSSIILKKQKLFSKNIDHSSFFPGFDTCFV